MKTEKWLEGLCQVVDDILFFNRAADRVAGGYLAGNNVLLSLTGTLFISSQIIEQIGRALDCGVKATVGVILLNNPPIEVDYEVIALPEPAIPRPQSETMDILELIDSYGGNQ